MRLTRPTGPPPRRGTRPGVATRTPTVEPGFLNPNRQVVERATGLPSAVRRHQTIYALRCRDCGLSYGCNGLDVKERRCPSCQGGVAGEPVAPPPPTLFD